MKLSLLVLVCFSLAASSHAWKLPYIVGGRDATVGEFPWQGSLQLFGSHACGAALVAKRWMVTAAHCIQLPGSYFKVILGAHDILTREKGSPKIYSVEKIIAHPDFKYDLTDPDIGLIKLTTDAELGTYVKTIAVAKSDSSNFAGADCVITGWGNTEEGSTGSPNILQAADTTPLTYVACEAQATDMPSVGAGIINDGHICIGGDNKEGSCHGDSGGPLVCKQQDGTKVLAGVTSWGDPKCMVKYPTIYSRISQFCSWLNTNSGGEVCN